MKKALVLALLCASVQVQAQTITAFAGSHSAAYSGDGGAAAQAALNRPVSIAFDPAGNAYIADYFNNVIRKVTPDGIISTFAGNHHRGHGGDGGPATDASFTGPWGVATDAVGNVYIADKGNNAIRKVGTDGIISTIAGTGEHGFAGDGGAATAAKLYCPLGMACDKAGNVYFSDNGNNVVRKIGTNGIISTVAGTRVVGSSGDGGQATAAMLNNPRGLATDKDGNLYIADTWNNKVRKVAANGTISTVAGNGIAGPAVHGAATATSLYWPVGVAVDNNGTIYVSDNHNHSIRSISSNGTLATLAGTGTKGYSGTDGPATAAQLYFPTGVATDAVGSVYFTEFRNDVVRKVPRSSMGEQHLTLAPNSMTIYPNPSTGDFTIELAEALDHPTVTITDVNGAIIERMNVDNAKATKIGVVMPKVAAGDYVVIVIAGQSTYTGKVVVIQ